MGAIFGVINEESNSDFKYVNDRLLSELALRGSIIDRRSVEEGTIFCVSKHSYDDFTGIIRDETQKITVMFEGEIYNIDDIRRDLNLPSNAGSKATDLSFIPMLYKKKGMDFAKDINGVFSIAVFDDAQRTLYLARDHTGSHSIFYNFDNGKITFASTIRAIFASCGKSPKISISSIDYYFSTVAVSPPRTMYENVFCVKPGCIIKIQNGLVIEHPYWELNDITEDIERSFDSFSEEIVSLFKDAVRIRATVGGKFAALLSGGVDTTAIATSLICENMCKELHGFSITFKEKSYDDGELQKYLYERYPIRQNSILLKPIDFANALVRGCRHLDMPVNDVAYAGMFKAFEAVREAGFYSIFEGEGSDEIFSTGHSHGELGIQPWLKIPKLIRNGIFRQLFPSLVLGNSLIDKISRFGCRIGMMDHERLSTWVPCFHSTIRKNMLNPDIRYSDEFYEDTSRYLKASSLKDPINRYQFILTKMFLPNDLLFKNERMAAANGLANRTPFIDYRLVELAFKIPEKFKIKSPDNNSDGTKLIFKQAAKDLIPAEILNRKKKRGFSQPTAVWYRNELKGFVNDLLLSQNSRSYEYLNQDFVKRIVSDHISLKANNDYYLNSILVFELWLRNNLI